MILIFLKWSIYTQDLWLIFLNRMYEYVEWIISLWKLLLFKSVQVVATAYVERTVSFSLFIFDYQISKFICWAQTLFVAKIGTQIFAYGLATPCWASYTLTLSCSIQWINNHNYIQYKSYIRATDYHNLEMDALKMITTRNSAAAAATTNATNSLKLISVSRSEFSKNIRTYNLAVNTSMKRHLSQSLRDAHAKIDGLNRSQQTTYKTMCKVGVWFTNNLDKLSDCLWLIWIFMSVAGK